MKDCLALQIILGPLFIVGTIGISMYGNSTIGFLLLVTHVMASLTVGFLFRFWKGTNSSKKNMYKNNKRILNKRFSFISFNKRSSDGPANNMSLSTLGSSISSSISNATSTILMIGGFIVIFSVVISILNESHLLSILGSFISPFLGFIKIPNFFAEPLISGFFEITNGIANIANIHIKTVSTNVALTSFILGTGGLSVFLQIYSIVSKTDLSIKPYIIGKILQGIFATFYVVLLMNIFPMFNFNL